jgi:hypothetical protein
MSTPPSSTPDRLARLNLSRRGTLVAELRSIPANLWSKPYISDCGRMMHPEVVQI